MGTQSRYPWRFHGVCNDPVTSLPVTLDFHCDVPSPNAWSRPEPDAAKVTNPCTRAVTMVINGNGVLPKRQARVLLRVPNLPDKATLLANIRTLARLHGPWVVDVPDLPGGETIQFMCDPTSGGLVETPMGALGMTVQIGLQEV